jgi:hypothetical protein
MCPKSFSNMRNGTKTRSYRSPIEGLPATGFWIARSAAPRKPLKILKRAMCSALFLFVGFRLIQPIGRA